ncbi:MAG: hypothetical protein CMQ88_02240 [Gammaproteobacteria bacterium]|nr:hypothetical protein [Gammaproteobacteria bacterium]|tara:strand:- start:1600 stop:1782 length:183 start_codon:yes stop_codon:yes gene_type:complete
MVESFILGSYIAGTLFGFYWGLAKGQKNGISDCIDNLIAQGYLKTKGHKNNPEILKWNEE